MHVYMHVCVYVCMYACMYVYTRVCACVCASMHVSMYVCMYVCMCLYTRDLCERIPVLEHVSVCRRTLQCLLSADATPLCRCSIRRCRRREHPSHWTVSARATASSRIRRRFLLVPNRTSSMTRRQSQTRMPTDTLSLSYKIRFTKLH